jgi:hypothetical protein
MKCLIVMLTALAVFAIAALTVHVINLFIGKYGRKKCICPRLIGGQWYSPKCPIHKDMANIG